jgi:hypothetical protein
VITKRFGTSRYFAAMRNLSLSEDKVQISRGADQAQIYEYPSYFCASFRETRTFASAGRSRPVQEQCRTDLRATLTLLRLWCWFLTKHDGALRLERQHAQQHARGEFRALD